MEWGGGSIDRYSVCHGLKMYILHYCIYTYITSLYIYVYRVVDITAWKMNGNLYGEEEGSLYEAENRMVTENISRGNIVIYNTSYIGGHKKND